jgi:hypothetical protein
MLAPEEITAGTFASSPAGGLILPRKRHETTAIVGLLDNEPTAVLLGDRFQFHYLPTAGSEDWSGLVIPKYALRSMSLLPSIRLTSIRHWVPW